MTATTTECSTHNYSRVDTRKCGRDTIHITECSHCGDRKANVERSYGTDPIFKGYSEAELHAAFGSVKDPDDWKAPIDAMIYGGHVGVVIAAIEFYTATEPVVSYRPDIPVSISGFNTWRVESEGYRAGPAGDH